MKATRGPALLLSVGMLVVTLTACTDNTGAIDQAGHNGFDRMTCTGFATMDNEVTHGAMSNDQARAQAEQLAATARTSGDPLVRQAGADLAAAYRTADAKAVAKARAEFKAACAW